MIENITHFYEKSEKEKNDFVRFFFLEMMSDS